MQQLFLRLVTLGEGADTRRRVERAELDSLDVGQGELALAIDAFGAARLLSFDRDPRSQAPTIEVAHEALLGEWTRLQDWISAARENLRAHRRLSAAAAEWLEAGRDPSMLLRGSQLVRFEALAAESGLARTELERSYLEASTAWRRDELAAEEARRAREAALERRSVNRLRALVGVLAVAALVAAGLTVFAFDQSSRSKHQTKIATARQLAAASAANLDVDPELSVLLALRAAEETGGGKHALPEAVDALHRAVAASRVVRTIHTQATAVSFSPDGSRLATVGSSPLTVWDAKTGKRLLSLGGATPGFRDVAFSPDGRRLAAGGGGGSAIVWDARTGRRLFALSNPLHGTGVYALGFSPDGSMLAADDGIGDVWIWDLAGRRAQRTIHTSHPLCGIAWSPDSARVATGDCGTHFSGSSARVWGVSTGRLVFETKSQIGAIPTVAFSPDGRYLGTPNRAGFAQIWDLATGRLVSTFKDHTGEVLGLAYGQGGKVVATSSSDGTARVWEASTGRQVLVLRGHAAPVVDLASGAGGSRVATASEDGTVRISDVTPEGSRDWLTINAHPGGVESVVYSPNGTQLLTTGLVDGRAKLWDARTGALLHSYAHFRDVGAAYIGGSGYPPQVSTTSPDGTMGAEVERSDSTLRLRDSATGDVLGTLARHAQSAAFDSTGKRIAAGTADGTVLVWDVHPLKLIRSFAAHKSIVEGVAFSPDGTLLATAGEDTTSKLWDLRTGKNVLTLTGHTRFLTAVAFSPDGKRLVTGSRDGTVRVYVLPVDELMTVARSRLSRGWTKEECAQYLPGGRCPRRP